MLPEQQDRKNRRFTRLIAPVFPAGKAAGRASGEIISVYSVKYRFFRIILNIGSVGRKIFMVKKDIEQET